jgi:hypothetical protein
MPAAALLAPRNSTFVQVRCVTWSMSNRAAHASHAKRQETVHIPVLGAFIWALQPDRVGNGPYWGCACRTRPCQQQGQYHSVAFVLVRWLARRWSEDGAGVAVGEIDREQSAKPKPQTPRATLLSEVKLEGAAAGFKADFIVGLQMHVSCKHMPSKPPAALNRRQTGQKLFLITTQISLCGDGVEGCLERSARAQTVRICMLTLVCSLC